MQPMSMSSEKNSYEDDACMYDHEETEESEDLLNELMQSLDKDSNGESYHPFPNYLLCFSSLFTGPYKWYVVLII